MNVLVLALQILLAVHTTIGALWKVTHSEHVMPSLANIPHGVWVGMSGLDMFCAIALIVSAFEKRLAVLAPIAASLVVAEMLFFSGVHLASGATNMGPVMYWLVVAAVGAFIIYGRLVIKPIRRPEFA